MRKEIVDKTHVMNFDCIGFYARKRINQKLPPGGGLVVEEAKSSAL